MSYSDSSIKLARQVVESHKRKLATATDKDGVRSSIRASEHRLDKMLASR